jgi:hypothetical protein
MGKVIVENEIEVVGNFIEEVGYFVCRQVV